MGHSGQGKSQDQGGCSEPDPQAPVSCCPVHRGHWPAVLRSLKNRFPTDGGEGDPSGWWTHRPCKPITASAGHPRELENWLSPWHPWGCDATGFTWGHFTFTGCESPQLSDFMLHRADPPPPLPPALAAPAAPRKYAEPEEPIHQPAHIY